MGKLWDRKTVDGYKIGTLLSDNADIAYALWSL